MTEPIDSDPSDFARRVAEVLPPGDPAHRFFDALTDEASLREFIDENDSRLADMARLTSGYVLMAAFGKCSFRGRYRHIVQGQLVRAFKLYESIGLLGDRMEIAAILLRPLVETAVDCLYLLGTSDRPRAAKRFLRSSLWADKVIGDGLLKHEPSSPAVQRLIGATTRTLVDHAGQLGSLTRGDKRWSADAQIEQRARKLGRLDWYDHVYRPLSHCVHGDWEDLASFHLRTADGVTYLPNPHHRAGHSGVVIVATRVVLDTCCEFYRNNEVKDAADMLQFGERMQAALTMIDEAWPAMNRADLQKATREALHEAELGRRKASYDMHARRLKDLGFPL